MADLFTIGYEGTTIAAVLDALEAAGVRLLIDVRAVAASRKPGFSKRQLAAGLDERGIAYVHLQPLGTPKPGRDAVRAGHPERMAAIYGTHIAGDQPQAALAEAAGLASTTRTCLLCFERDPAHCHRHIVAEFISRRTGQAVRDLFASTVT
ncbi:MAG: DUF488 family protein [Acetobacteraceae bacterium]